jgi:hypothetical protein
MNTERESTSVDEVLGIGAAAPVDAPMNDGTWSYFKERYAPLYRYANAVETGGAIIALIGGFGGFILSIGSLDDLPGPVAFVAVIVIATLAVGFYMACQLLAAAVRAFADMVVSSAPGLDVEARLAIIRGGSGATDIIATPAPLELTGPFADRAARAARLVRDADPARHHDRLAGTDSAEPAPTPSSASLSGPRVPPGFHTPPTPPAAPAVHAPTAAATTGTARTTETSRPPVTTDADVSLEDDFGEDPTGIPPPPAAPPSALDAPTWYLAWDGEPTGPWTEAQLRQGIVERTVTAASLVWKVGEQGGWGRLDADPHLRTSAGTLN